MIPVLEKGVVQPANILVVDDTPANLQLLAGILKARGHRVRPVPGGELALEAARRDPPDLILLDINMPGMNGYEVCKRLKADPALEGIPVIFVSALDEYLDKVAAFTAGGADYLTKPFQMEELHARVDTHLRLRRLIYAPVAGSSGAMTPPPSPPSPGGEKRALDTPSPGAGMRPAPVAGVPKGREARQANILVVDDTPANLRLLAGILQTRGHKVRPVPDGELALAAARRDPPDLILLDITMPGMDGYEVCRQLKADDALEGIPVIFVSALDEHLDKVAAFAAGGADYLTKPFQMEEVNARVDTHLKLRRMLVELKEFQNGSRPPPARWGKF